jgi:hypothetical protein
MMRRPQPRSAERIQPTAQAVGRQMYIGAGPEGAKETAPRATTLLPLPQIIHNPAHHRSPVRPRNPRQKREKRSIDLCPRRLHGAKEIRSKLRQRNKGPDRHHPSPRPSRPQHPQQDARRQNQQSREQQIIDHHISPPAANPADSGKQIKERIAFEVFIQQSKINNHQYL